MKALRLFVAVMLLTISSACVLSAQDNSPVNKSYIYCTVAFESFKVEKEKQVHSYTQKYTERMFKMKIDCRQYDSDLNGFFGIINDERQTKRVRISNCRYQLAWSDGLGNRPISDTVQTRFHRRNNILAPHGCLRIVT